MENQNLELNPKEYDQLVVKLSQIFFDYGFSTSDSAKMAVEALQKVAPKTSKKTIADFIFTINH